MRISGMLLTAATVWLVVGIHPAAAAEEKPCEGGSFKQAALYVLVSQAGGTCWHQLTPRRVSILRTDPAGKIEPLRRPITTWARFRYVPAADGYAESALAIQSRSLEISAAADAKGSVVTSRSVTLFRGPVGTVCAHRADQESDSDSMPRLGPRFNEDIKVYNDFHNASTDVRTRLGTFRDFHFKYARVLDKQGRAAICIETNSVRDGNLRRYTFQDLQNARLEGPDPNFLVALLNGLFGGVANALQDSQPEKYVYSDLQSLNIWFKYRSEDSVEFRLRYSTPIQVVSLSNLEERNEAEARFYLMKWDGQ